MKKKDFQSRQVAMRQACLDVGEQAGIQKMWDYLQLVLHDPKIMGKDTFGPDRLKKIYEGLKQLVNEYHIAFTMDREADYYQEKLDAQLREIWGGDIVEPFYDRYPYMKQMDYSKGKRDWR